MNVLFISLGCDKNLVDSEVMIGLLADKGYLDGVLAEGAARADAIARRTLAKVYKKIGFLQL